MQGPVEDGGQAGGLHQRLGGVGRRVQAVGVGSQGVQKCK